MRRVLNKLVSSCLAVFSIAMVAVLVVGGAFVPLIGPGLERKLGEPGDVPAFMLLMLANLAVTLPLSVFPTILDGLQRFGEDAPCGWCSSQSASVASST